MTQANAPLPDDYEWLKHLRSREAASAPQKESESKSSQSEGPKKTEVDVPRSVRLAWFERALLAIAIILPIVKGATQTFTQDDDAEQTVEMAEDVVSEITRMLRDPRGIECYSDPSYDLTRAEIARYLAENPLGDESIEDVMARTRTAVGKEAALDIARMGEPCYWTVIADTTRIIGSLNKSR